PGPLVEPLVFDGVSFQYQPDGPAVLKDIRLKIGVGEKVGIIGGIGSGKSTLLKLLVNLQMPTTGQVLWNGIPVHHYHSDRLRRHMGVAFQSATFFRGTIKENITLGRSDVPEQELLSALQVSGALAWIKSQPLGLDTQIGENGTGLSSGQRQTLVIARAFLGERSCYVLDEPTSDLDIRTENALVHRLRQIDKTRTLILVSHRQQLLEAVDRLIVMEKGRILLDGEKTEVMGQLKTIVETENRKSA
ncbi:MAG: ATP-binding cassette domain-containing protein, partial [Pseudomonadota bacterium]